MPKHGKMGITNESIIIFTLPEQRSYEMTIELRSAPLKDKEQVIEMQMNDTFFGEL